MERLQYVVNGTPYNQMKDVRPRDLNVVQHLRFWLFDTPPFDSLLREESTLHVDYEAVSIWSAFGTGRGVPSRLEALDALWSVDTWAEAPMVDLQQGGDITTQVVNQQHAMILSQMYLHPLPTEERTRLQDLIAKDVDAFFREIRRRSDDTPFRAVTVSKDDGRWTFDVDQSMTLAVTYRDDPDARIHIEISRRVLWDEESIVIHTDSRSNINGGNRLTSSEVDDLQSAATSIAGGTLREQSSSSRGCCVGLPAGMIVLAILAILLTECA